MQGVPLKYKKYHKTKKSKLFYEPKRLTCLYGSYGLRADVKCLLTAKQIEAMRRVAKKVLKKNGHFFLMVKADRPVTKKPGEVRMGKGKGSVENWVSVIERGTILIELGGDLLTSKLAFLTLAAVAEKLGIKTESVSYKS